MSKSDLDLAFPRIDYTDICAIVQRIREICWTATFNRPRGQLPRWLSHHDLDSFQPFLDDLHLSMQNLTDESRKTVVAALIRETEMVLAALKQGAWKSPSVDEVLKRYVKGDIGERTAQEVLDLDIREFHATLLEHGFSLSMDDKTEH